MNFKLIYLVTLFILAISFPSLAAQEMEIEIELDSEETENEEFEYDMDFDLEEGEEVEVEMNVLAKRKAKYATKSQAPNATVITAEDLQSSGASSVVDILAENGIVAMQETGSRSGGDQIYLQGIDASRILVVIDGQRVRAGASASTGAMQGTTSALKRIPITSIESIEIVKGPGSYMWGSDAIGGVIYIQTKRGSGEEGFHGSAGASYKNNFEGDPNNNYFRPYFNFNYGLDNGSIWAGTSFEYGDNWLSEHTNNIPNVRDEYINFDIYGGANFDIADIHTLEVAGKYQQEYSPLNKEEVNDEELPSRTAMLYANYSVYPLDNLDVNISSGLTYDYKKEIQFKKPTDDINEDAYFFNDNRFTFDYYIDDIFSVNGGYSLDLEVLDERNINKKYYQHSHAFFFGAVAEVKDVVDFDATAGIRYQLVGRDGTDVEDTDELLHSFSPELGIVLTPIKYVSIKAHVGHGFKAPSLIESFGDYYNHGDTFWLGSNPDLKPESSWGYSGTVEIFPMDEMSFSVGIFRNDIENLIAYEDNPSSSYQGLPVYKTINIDQAYTWGVNAGTKANFSFPKFGLLEYGFNFEYLWAREVLPESSQLIDSETGERFNPRLANRPEYTLSGSIGWKKKEWGTSLKISGYYFAPGYEYRFDGINSDGNFLFEETRTEFRSSLDLRIAQEIPPPGIYDKLKTEIYFDVANLLNSIYDRDGDGDTDTPERQWTIGFNMTF